LTSSQTTEKRKSNERGGSPCTEAQKSNYQKGYRLFYNENFAAIFSLFFLPPEKETTKIMKNIKKIFDPKNILNEGKIFD